MREDIIDRFEFAGTVIWIQKLGRTYNVFRLPADAPFDALADCLLRDGTKDEAFAIFEHTVMDEVCDLAA